MKWFEVRTVDEKKKFVKAHHVAINVTERALFFYNSEVEDDQTLTAVFFDSVYLVVDRDITGEV